MSLTILVVDDDESVQRMLSRALQREGHIVLQARRLDLAEELIHSQDPDVIFLDGDVACPLEESLKLFDRHKAEYGDCFVAMSATDMPDQRSRGMVHSWDKTSGVEGLRVVLERFLP